MSKSIKMVYNFRKKNSEGLANRHVLLSYMNYNVNYGGPFKRPLYMDLEGRGVCKVTAISVRWFPP